MIESEEIGTNPSPIITLTSNDNTININQLICRLCGNTNEKLIGIYSEEGVSNELAYKINEYLPIKVQENDDDLPLQCCLNCINTLLAWHELFITTVTTANRFQDYLTNKQVIVDVAFVETKNIEADSTAQRVVPDQLSSSLNDFCQISNNATPFKRQTRTFKNKKKPTTATTNLTTFYNQSNFETYIIPDIEPHLINENVSSSEQPEFKIDIEDTKLLTNDDDKGITHRSSSSSDDDDDDDVDSDIDKSRKLVFVCPCCSAVFALKKDVKNHINTQHPGNENLTPIPKDIPEQSKFNSEKERRKNNKLDQDATNAAKVIVDGRIYYNCKECGKSLHSPYTYMWHMRIHTGERPYVCDLCGKQFRVSQGLVRHLRETHQGIKKFPCDLCGRMFATRRNVEEHRRIHTNERPYICDLCGKSFKQKASLFVHKRSHKNYFPFKCNYCNQGFRTKPPLMVHITRHTGEKPYKCETCGRCFRIKYELKRHRLIHSDEKPFHCTVCGLNFRQKRYLRNHMKSNHSLTLVNV